MGSISPPVLNQHYKFLKRKGDFIMQGVVKFFNRNKGWGFITDIEGEDVFVHHSSIVMDGFRYLSTDDIVNYELGTDNNGREQAVNVTQILTRQIAEDSLKKENLYIQTQKDSYGVKKYLVVDENNVIQTDESGMSFMELAKYAGFEILKLSA